MSHPVDPGSYSEPTGRTEPVVGHPASSGYAGAEYAQSGAYADSGSHAVGYSQTASSTGGRDVSDVSVGEIMSNISADMSTLMRQEIALAKAEITVEAKKAAIGAGMLAAAGVAAFFTLLFAAITLWWALGELLGDAEAWSALIVTILFAIAAAVLALMGKKKLQQVNPKPERTVETLQEAPSALKPTN